MKKDFYKDLDVKKISILVAFHYRAKTIISVEELEKSVSAILKKLIELNEAG
jgi:hypothetical protein